MRFAERTQETAHASGLVSTLTLLGRKPGCQAFAEQFTVGTSNIAVCIEQDGEAAWQVCLCTLTATNQLRVDTVLSSSEAGAQVAFPSGLKNVFSTVPAQALVALLNSQQ